MTASVDDYIEAASPSAQPMLRQLREVIRNAAPQAEERISYGMPHYAQQGRVAYFAAQKNHVALYSISPETDYAKELRPYMSGRGTLRFPIGQPLPTAKISRMIQARVKENLARA